MVGILNSNFIDIKGIGNSTTISFDVEGRDTVYFILLSLSEMVGMRLRDTQNCCRLVAISIRSSDFISYSRQRKFECPRDSTTKIWNTACELFNESWKGEPVRNLGLRVSELCSNEFRQVSLFDERNTERLKALARAVDRRMLKYGTTSVIRGVFLHSGLSPING